MQIKDRARSCDVRKGGWNARQVGTAVAAGRPDLLGAYDRVLARVEAVDECEAREEGEATEEKASSSEQEGALTMAKLIPKDFGVSKPGQWTLSFGILKSRPPIEEPQKPVEGDQKPKNGTKGRDGDREVRAKRR
jgi:hypothetical protein